MSQCTSAAAASGPPTMMSAEEQELALQQEALKLRAGLEGLFERVRVQSKTADEQATSTEEQFLLLVSQYSEQALARAVLMTAETTPEAPFTGRLPIHLACEYSAPIEVIRFLLDNDVQRQSILVKDKWGDLPIHIACSRDNYVEVVELLLESDTHNQTIFVKDSLESMPLHMACRYLAEPAVFHLLLENDKHKRSLFEEGIHGQYPIHVACRGDAPPEIIRLLLQADDEQKSVLKQDEGGRLPIHVYLTRYKNLEVIKLLLEAMFCNRMERLGVENWKHNMQSLRKSLGVYERDFMTREMLDFIIAALNGAMEREFVLELAIWRASCLGFSERHYESMSDVVRLGDTDTSFDVGAYKKQQRIKSGAQTIIPHVLPFLEDEPVTEVLDQIKKLQAEMAPKKKTTTGGKK